MTTPNDDTPARIPAPGDVVLIRATVASDQPGGELLAVSVITDTEELPLTVRRHTVAEIVGPSWCPPKRHDVVIDADGRVWQYEATNDDRGMWTSPESYWPRRNTTELMNQHGPLILAFRDGEPWDL